MKRRRLLFAGIFLVIAAGAGLLVARAYAGNREARAALDDAVADRPVFAVSVAPAVVGPIVDYLDVNGDVVSVASVSAYSDASGEVVRVVASTGQSVREGDIVAEVDPSRPGQQFSIAPVRAPISGTVVDTPVRTGMRITPNTPIAEIAQTDELEVVSDVAERFLGSLNLGASVTIEFTALPETSFRGVVREISPVVDPTTRTLEVKTEILSRDRRLRPGMFARLRIVTTQRSNVVKAPADAIVRRQNATTVLVVDGENIARVQTVEIGIEIDNEVEITAGLQGGELLVTQGKSLVGDGDAVRIVTSDP